MIYNILGKTGLKVSKIGLGTLTMGGLQKKLTKAEYLKVLSSCIEHGINLFDTAEIYQSYHIVKDAIKLKPDIIVSSKSYAYDENGAERALNDCLKSIGRDYIDVFLMHEQESEHTIKGHYSALKFYLKQKKLGKIRAVGLSTHKVECVRACAKFKEIEVVHPLINYKGHGILDGERTDMENAVKRLHDLGVGIMAMKIFGGGHLIKNCSEAFDYVLNKSYIDSIIIGMAGCAEVEFNVSKVLNLDTDVKLSELDKIKRAVHVEDHCVLCGECKDHCPQNAISVLNNKINIDYNKCVLCSYCANFCKELAIKVY
ncbi:MAG: aldo/keto reductase [Firmicutes bacterium]|nr:aldo/keto reductase [Bacillota bacterium]